MARFGVMWSSFWEILVQMVAAMIAATPVVSIQRLLEVMPAESLARLPHRSANEISDLRSAVSPVSNSSPPVVYPTRAIAVLARAAIDPSAKSVLVVEKPRVVVEVQFDLNVPGHRDRHCSIDPVHPNSRRSVHVISQWLLEVEFAVARDECRTSR